MRKVKLLNGWGIFKNNNREFEEYGFEYTVIHPNNMEICYTCSPSDSDWECDSLKHAIDWIINY